MTIEQLVEAARKTLRVKAWSPSRFAKWKECPRKVLFEDLMKMCPVCFKGRVSGGFDGEPVKCDACSGPQPEREALDRGNRLDAALTSHLSAVKPAPKTGEVSPHEVALAEATRHPRVKALVATLRKSKGVFQQYRIALNEKWERLHEDPDRGIWPRGVWGRVVLDVLHLTPKIAKVIDWKSGNIDKRTQEIRPKEEYNDSMRAYQTAVLSCHPQAEASATMVFLDAPPKLADPTKSLPVLKRKDLEAAQRDWGKKIAPMMNDDVFPPRPGYYCNWCPFSKQRKGGPCPH